MKDKLKKAVVLILAILTTLAFSPFLFSTPDTPQESNNNSVERNATTTATSTSL